MQPEQQQRIMGYFIEEATAHLNTIEQGLLNLQNTLQNPEMVYEVFRAAHSVKGGAAMLGISSVQKTAHSLEDSFSVLKQSARNADPKLVFLLMRVFEALQEILNQVIKTGQVQDEVANGIAAAVEPVFEELKNHLHYLVDGTPEPAPTTAEVSNPSSAAKKNRLAIQKSFQKDITKQLLKMLQLFKQPDKPEVRQQLQQLCHGMGNLGKQLDLPTWSELLEASAAAIANRENSLDTLANVIIKEIKQAQELVLTGRFAEVIASSEMKALLPPPPVTPSTNTESPDLFKETSLKESDIERTEKAQEKEKLEITSPEFENFLFSNSHSFLSPPTEAKSERDDNRKKIYSQLSKDTEAGAIASDLDKRQAVAPSARVVEMAELNSLADMLEGEAAEIDETWQSEEIISPITEEKASLPLELFSDFESDFSEIMIDKYDKIDYEKEVVSKEDDFMSLFGDYIQSEGVGEGAEGKTDDFTSWFGDDMPAGDNEYGDIAEFLDISLDTAPSSVEDTGDDRLLDLIGAEEGNLPSGAATLSSDALENSPGVESSWNNWLAEFDENDSLLTGEENSPSWEIEDFNKSAEATEESVRSIGSLPDTPTASEESASELEWDAIDTMIDGREMPQETAENQSDWDFSAFEETLSLDASDAGEDLEELEATLDFVGLDELNADNGSVAKPPESLPDTPTASEESAGELEWDAIDTMIDGSEMPQAEAQNQSDWDFSAFEETLSLDASDAGEDLEELEATLDFVATDELKADNGSAAKPPDSIAEEWDIDAALSSLGDLSLPEVSPDAEEDSSSLFGTEADIAPAADGELEDLFDSELASLWEHESESVPADAAERMEALFDEEGSLGLNEETNLETGATLETDIAGGLLELEALMSLGAAESGESLLDVGAIDSQSDLGLNEDWALEGEEAQKIDADAALRELSSSLNLETSVGAEDAWADLGALFSADGESAGWGDELDLDVSETAATSPAMVVSGLDELDELEGLLGSDVLSDRATPLASVSQIEGLDELDELEGLLGSDVLSDRAAPVASDSQIEGLDEFDELEGLLGASVAAGGDELDDLDALLNEPNSALAGTEAFDELDDLLGSELPSQASLAAPAPEVAVDDGFGDLEELLKGADKFGGMSAAPLSSSQERSRNRPERKKGEQTMRVPVRQLDNLSNLVGELVVSRNSLEQDQERMRQFLDNLLHQVHQLSDVGARMQNLYERSLLENSLNASRQNHRGLSKSVDASSQNDRSGGTEYYDPLEMDRFTPIHLLSQEMIELIVRVRESTSDIEFLVDETDQVARMLRQVTSQLQEGLTRSRMVPFAQTADRLQRVRDNAYKYGKKVELIVEGRETLLDKMLLEHLTDPLNHMLNNAIAHGVETPDVREASGKPPVGKIIVQAFHTGNQTVISVADDGAGIDTERVKAKAIEKRLISPAQAETMSKPEVYDLLFHPNFSTKDSADELSGRGVGMDVVRTELNEIRGTIATESTLGKGTTFTIRLPLNLSIGKALCCVSNRASIAFSMDGVEDTIDVPNDAVQTNEAGDRCIAWRDALVPFRPLSELLKYNRQIGRGIVYGGTRDDDMTSVVMLRGAGYFLAVEVDKVIGEQEIVIKQLQGPVPKPVGMAGATVLGDGRVMPIADILELIDLSRGVIRTVDDGTIKPEEPEVKTEPIVLIIDDSITVRKMLSMTFDKAGYRVEQARDGQEAWDKLRSGLPCDVVFCDMEMPRMDGLTLLSKLQQDETLKHLPVAMLTSRGAERHRQMAAQRGARGYFTKPCLDEVLTDAARRMMAGEVLLTVTASV